MRQRVQLEIFLTILAILSSVFIISAYDHDQRMDNWEKLHRAQSIQHGAALYDLNCRSCHGVNGEGVGDLGPALNDEAFFLQRIEEVYWTGTLEEYIENAISTGRIVPTREFYAGDGQLAMNAWSQKYGGPLRDDEIRDLTAFVLNWKATALGELELAAPQVHPTPNAVGEAREGEKIFIESGCSECHAIDKINEIAAPAPNLTNIATVAESRRSGLSAEGYLRESFLIPNAYFVDGYGENSGCGGVLSNQQLEHLIAFLITLK